MADRNGIKVWLKTRSGSDVLNRTHTSNAQKTPHIQDTTLRPGDEFQIAIRFDRRFELHGADCVKFMVRIGKTSQTFLIRTKALIDTHVMTQFKKWTREDPPIVSCYEKFRYPGPDKQRCVSQDDTYDAGLGTAQGDVCLTVIRGRFLKHDYADPFLSPYDPPLDWNCRDAVAPRVIRNTWVMALSGTQGEPISFGFTNQAVLIASARAVVKRKADTSSEFNTPTKWSCSTSGFQRDNRGTVCRKPAICTSFWHPGCYSEDQDDEEPAPKVETKQEDSEEGDLDLASINESRPRKRSKSRGFPDVADDGIRDENWWMAKIKENEVAQNRLVQEQIKLKQQLERLQREQQQVWVKKEPEAEE